MNDKQRKADMKKSACTEILFYLEVDYRYVYSLTEKTEKRGVWQHFIGNRRWAECKEPTFIENFEIFNEELGPKLASIIAAHDKQPSGDKFLSDLANELKEQDNLATSYPLYCVFDTNYIYGFDPLYHDSRWKWRYKKDCDSTTLYEPDLSDWDSDIWEFEITPKEAEESSDWFKVYYMKLTQDNGGHFVTAHLTMKAAKQYIEENRHNLDEPHVYVTSLNRCHEMIEIYKRLRSNALATRDPGKVEAALKGAKSFIEKVAHPDSCRLDKSDHFEMEPDQCTCGRDYTLYELDEALKGVSDGE